MSDTAPETTDWVSVFAVTLGITAFALAQGLTYPLLSFLLSDMGASGTLVGVHATVFMLGFVTSVLMLPTLIGSCPQDRSLQGDWASPQLHS